MVDVVQPVHQARGVVEVARCCCAVAPGLQVHDLGRCAARTNIHPRAGQLQLQARPLAVQHHVAPDIRDHFLDEGTRKGQSTVRGQSATAHGDALHHRGDRLAEPQTLEQRQRPFMDRPFLGAT